MDPALKWTLAAALSILFASSAAIKLAALSRFAAAVENYRILPRRWSWLTAVVVPVLEASAAIGLLISATREPAAIAAALLIAMFSAAIAINLARGRREIDCGCFGAALRQTLSGWLLARNAILIAAAAAIGGPERVRPLQMLDAITVVFGAATLTALYASMNHLIANAFWIGELERMRG